MTLKGDLKQAFSFQRNLKSLFVRPKHQIPMLDGLRALAILLVFVCHIFFYAQMYFENTHEEFQELPFWFEWLLRGDLGVDVFFVISGFLIGGILFREFEKRKTIRIKRFFLRRFFRLMPVYWYALFSSAAVVYFLPPLKYHAVEIPKNILSIWMNLLYINNFFSFEQTYAPMAHSWSLAVEEQFYIVCPFAILLFMKTRLRQHLLKICIFTLLVYLGVRWMVRAHATELFISKCGVLESDLKRMTDFSLQITRSERNLCLFGTEIDVVYDNLYSKFIALFAGVVAAYLAQFKESKMRAFFKKSLRTEFLASLAVALVIISFLDKHLLENFYQVVVYRTFFYQIILSVGLSLLILIGLYGEGWFTSCLQWFLSLRLWYPVAQVSYSMYLYHVGFIGLSYELAKLYMSSPSLLKLLAIAVTVVFPMTLVASAISYLTIEKPIMNLRHYFDDTSDGEST